MKALKIAGTALAAVIVIFALLLVVGVPSGFLTSAIQDRVEQQTGYRLTIDGTTKISLWPTLNVRINDLTLQDPKERDTSRRLTIGSVEADVTLSSLWSGHPRVSQLVITKPVMYRQLLRERTLDGTSRSTKSAPESETATIDHIKIVDGAIIATNARDRFERRIEGISADATIDADHRFKIAGTARTDSTPLKFDVSAEMPASPAGRRAIPVELTLEAPGLLRGPLSAKAEVRLNGPLISINNVAGTLGDGAFNGWASVDIGSKPLVKLDLDFQRLDLGSSTTAAPASTSQGWSEAPISLIGLNYVDAQVRISATQLNIGAAQFAPAAIDATLAAGVLKSSFANLGAYGGQANGELIVDASNGSPSFAMHCDFVGVRALPLLTNLADFDRIDGKMQAKIAARSSGDSQQALMSNLSGTAFVIFQDGSIRGLNVAQMIRSLTASTLNGWQEQQEKATDLSQLSASFRIDHGQAVTTDLNLIGPLVKVTGAGTIDIGTRMMGFRVEPKLVMTTEGQGRTSDPVGFGIPVMIEGPWSQPRIYPEMQGILDNPEAAYAKLREMGKGLFGKDGGGLGGLLGGLSALNGNQSGAGNGGNNGNGPLGGALGGNLGQALGNLLQQGLGSSRSIPPRNGAEQGDAQAPSAQAAPSPPPPEQPQAQNDAPQDSQAMNDVLRQLFNRQ
jgi:AsmA protein